MRSLRHPRTSTVLSFVIFAGLALLPTVFGSGANFLSTMEYVLALTMVASGLNIVTGFAGQLSLGSGPICVIAAYAAAITAEHLPSDTGLAAMCAIGLVVAAVAGLIIGVPALRISGFYLAMATLLLALVVATVSNNLSITGGENGITLIGTSYKPQWTGLSLYEIGVGLLVVVTFFSWLLLHSRIGTRFQLVASSQDLAASLGVPVYRTKLIAFILSALPAGIGGAFFYYSQGYMSANSISPQTAIYLLAACVIGGMGTVIGPIIGGLIVLCLTQFLGGFSQYTGIVFGTVLALMALLMPDGLMGFGAGVGRRLISSWIPRMSTGQGLSRSTRSATRS